MRDQPYPFIGVGSPERHAAFVQRRVMDDIVLFFDDLSDETRLWAWRPEMGLRERLIANMGRYRRETREYLQLMMAQTYWGDA